MKKCLISVMLVGVNGLSIASNHLVGEKEIKKVHSDGRLTSPRFSGYVDTKGNPVDEKGLKSSLSRSADSIHTYNKVQAHYPPHIAAVLNKKQYKAQGSS